MRILIFFLLVNHVSCSIFCQEINSKEIKEIDSLLIHYDKATSEGDNVYFYDILRKSIQINYKTGILKSHLNLMRYYGYQRNLDSTSLYIYKFENNDFEDQDRELKFTYFYNKAGIMYTIFGFNEQALEHYNIAYSYIDPDNITENIQIKSDLAYLYILKNQLDKAIEILSPYLADTSKITGFDKLKLITGLAMAYQHKEMPDKSLELHKIALQEAKKHQLTESILYLNNNISLDYFIMGDYKKAINSALANREKLVYTGNNGVINSRMSTNLNNNSQLLSTYYGKIGDYNKAIHYLQEVINSNPSNIQLAQNYEDLAIYYKELNDKDNLISTLNKRNAVIDSIRKTEKELFIDYYDTKIRFADNLRENEKMETEKHILKLQNTRQKQLVFILAFGLTCILLVITVVLIYRKYFKTREKVKKLEKNERELLKKHIEVREHELTLLIQGKSKLLSELDRINKELLTALEDDNLSAISKTTELLKSLLQSTSEDNAFLERLESQYPGIVVFLKQKHPDLTPNEIRHCILVLLGLTVKESAQLLNVGLGAIKMGRNRAKTKMNLSPDISLQEYLSKISDNYIE